jgi:hypothetical protein
MFAPHLLANDTQRDLLILRLSNIRSDRSQPMEPCFELTTHLAAYFQRRGLYENENRITF